MTDRERVWHISLSMANPRATIGTGELAEALNVDPRTIRYWLTSEDPEWRIVPDVWTAGGHARFTQKSVARLVRTRRRERPKRAA